MSLRRDHHGRTYHLRVCPYHGGANAGCCDRDTIIIETVPAERVREIQASRDEAVKQHRALLASRQVACHVRGAVLFGSRQAVAEAQAYIAELRARADA